jgi:hypothetical protein
MIEKPGPPDHVAEGMVETGTCGPLRATDVKERDVRVRSQSVRTGNSAFKSWSVMAGGASSTAGEPSWRSITPIDAVAVEKTGKRNC